MRYLAIDPGTQKAGLAIAEVTSATEPLRLLYRDILPVPELITQLSSLLSTYQPDICLVGAGTGSAHLLESLRKALPQVAWQVVEERNTTMEARELYFQYHPPRWWQRLLPKGFRIPPEPYDDYAALVLIRRAVGD